MTFDEARRKINRYLKKRNAGLLVVDVQNSTDLNRLVMEYHLTQGRWICASASDYCEKDEFPKLDNLITALQREQGTVFVRELSTFYKLKGEADLVQMLEEMLFLNISGHVIMITYQCRKQLERRLASDNRLSVQVCIVDGRAEPSPNLIFVREGMKGEADQTLVNGIDRIPAVIERGVTGELLVQTKKSRNSFPNTLYPIREIRDAYRMLCSMDNATEKLPQELFAAAEWEEVLGLFAGTPSWYELIQTKVGNPRHLDMVISEYENHQDDRLWKLLYFAGLKLFGAGNNTYLNQAAQRADHAEDLVDQLYRMILEIEPETPGFADLYQARKSLLRAVGSPITQVSSFCKIVMSRGEKALDYLTDLTDQEKEAVFRVLDQYGIDYDRNALMKTLERVYPDLALYLMPYRFKNGLLDDYFQDYKYQKAINKVLPEFLDTVNMQAVEREYNAILQPRSAYVEKINTHNAQTYFTDAMGVEFLGYILARCQHYHLLAKVTVCRCELPSITTRNKEFWDVLNTAEFPIRTISDIDEVKHHGKDDSDYLKSKLPIHLIRELEIIDNLLKKIQANLIGGKYGKAILISDHGASRLAVISETENMYQMGSNGKHSGRCCPKSELDQRPDAAVDADDFWALASYDRFKGSRKADVEVHGGATLEEVTVPIIELSYLSEGVEVKIMPVDSIATFSGTPEIRVSYRKKAAIKIFATQDLQDVSVEIDGHAYDAVPQGNGFYVVESMPEIRRAKLYQVNVYSCGNLIAEGLPLQVKKESGSERGIL